MGPPNPPSPPLPPPTHSTHELAATQASLDTAKQQLAILSGAHLVKQASASASASTSVSASASAPAASEREAEEGEDSRQKDATIQQLRADLLHALQTADQSSQVRSNLLTCQSELQSVHALYVEVCVCACVYMCLFFPDTHSH